MALDEAGEAEFFGLMDKWADARAQRLAEEAAKKEAEKPADPPAEKPKGLVQQILGM